MFAEKKRLLNERLQTVIGAEMDSQVGQTAEANI